MKDDADSVPGMRRCSDPGRCAVVVSVWREVVRRLIARGVSRGEVVNGFGRSREKGYRGEGDEEQEIMRSFFCLS